MGEDLRGIAEDLGLPGEHSRRLRPVPQAPFRLQPRQLLGTEGVGTRGPTPSVPGLFAPNPRYIGKVGGVLTNPVPLSNRTCGFPTSGSPTIVALY